jgi:hypothetical protein
MKCTEDRPCFRCQQRNIHCENANNEKSTPGRASFASSTTIEQNLSQEFTLVPEVEPTCDAFQNVTECTDPAATMQDCGGNLRFPMDVPGNNPYRPQGQVVPQAIASVTDIPLSAFLRGLLLPGDFDQQLLLPDSGVVEDSAMVQDFDFRIDYNFTDWNISAFDYQDGWSNIDPTAWPVPAQSVDAPSASREDIALAASARAFKNSIWHWVPVVKDSLLANQAELRFCEDSQEKQDQRASPKTPRKLDNATRDKVFAMLLDSCHPTTLPRLISSFPSRAFLERNLWKFLQTHSELWDTWIHIPTFETSKISPALVAIVFAAGACLAPIEAIRNFGYALHEVIINVVAAMVRLIFGHSSRMILTNYCSGTKIIASQEIFKLFKVLV